MLQALAVIMAAGIGATVSVLVFVVGSSGLTKLEKLSTLIEKIEPGQQRDALITLRRQMVQRYLQRVTRPAGTQALPWLFSGIVIMGVGFFGTTGLPQFLVDIMQISSPQELRPVIAITSAITAIICVAGLVTVSIGGLKLFKAIFTA